MLSGLPEDQAGVVEVRYSTATRISITFETGATAATTDDTMRIDALDSSTALTPGPGCKTESATRVRCDGAFTSGSRFTINSAVSIGPSVSGSGTTDDVFVLNGVRASRTDPRIRTGSGNDLINLSNSFGSAGLMPVPFADRFEVDAGPGNDEVIEGNRAILATMGDGDDLIRPRRNEPPQAIAAAAGPSTFDGGEGLDVINESGRNRSFTIDLGAGTIRNLGLTGPSNLEANVSRMENAVGSGRDDTIRGTSANNKLIGGAGADTIEGLDGDDMLAAFNDLTPQPNAPATETEKDILRGGTGADTLNVAGDALKDTADCGPNGERRQSAFVNGQIVTFTFSVGDKVFADLADAPVNCEDVQLQDKDERGTVAITVLSKQPSSSGQIRIRLSCPAQALTDCDGEVGIRLGKGPATPGPGAVEYKVRKGKHATATVTLPEGKIKKVTLVRLIAVEQGRKNPRTRVIVLYDGKG